MNRRDNFVQLAETLPQMVWRTLPNGSRDYFNQRWYEYTGLSFEQSKGKGWSLILHPDDYERTINIWQTSFKTGQPYEIEYRFHSKEGNYRWFLGKALPAYDSIGNIIYWYGTSTDIHNRKMVEEACLLREHKLMKLNEILDSFVRIAAHDLRSPLNNMQSLLYIFKEVTEEEKKRQVMVKLENSVIRMQETIGSMESLLRWQEEGKPEVLTLRFSDLFERVKHSLFALLEQQEVIFELDFKAIKIRYIEAYLFSIMRNLISNAIKYSAPDRDCKISLLTEKLDKGILLTIRDNGIGINLEKHGHELFDSFKRFSKQAGGIGLGLYLIRQMVKHNGGSIEVESQLDYGTTFRLYLIEYS